MGSQGRSPRQGLGAVAPVKSPFPGERGQGDRGSELEVCFKNILFLQSVAVQGTAGNVLCVSIYLTVFLSCATFIHASFSQSRGNVVSFINFSFMLFCSVL